ncbi:denn domain-containing [Anaeramoeba flamelloides]|uniref:Denn domain-containing n=1 Tax=Anaeramoeba flamelloides TaxID=1746091 RepID=A0AAV7YE56_9EUKA|nr:denn domain-containing [Anaeramoeba flamelloides]
MEKNLKNKLFERFYFVTYLEENLKLKSKTNKFPEIHFGYSFPKMKNDEFPSKIQPFCFADLKILKEHNQISVENYYFVLTDSQGFRNYVLCQETFYNNSTPLELCVFITKHSLFLMFEKLLRRVAEIHKKYNKKKFEKILKNLYLKSVPEPGMDLKLSIPSDNNQNKLIEYEFKHSNSLLGEYDLEHLFQIFDATKVTSILASILFERRIIFTSCSLKSITNVIQACLGLLQPFEWFHILIPVLPERLLDTCCAPMPYIIGIHETFLNKLDNIPIEKIVLANVDTGELIFDPVDLVCLPSRLTINLIKSVSIYLDKWHSDGIFPRNEIVGEFLDFFIKIFYNYEDFLIHPKSLKEKKLKEKTEQSKNKKKNINKFDNFDFEAFKSRTSKNIKKFLNPFSQTQMFEVFIRERTNRFLKDINDKEKEMNESNIEQEQEQEKGKGKGKERGRGKGKEKENEKQNKKEIKNKERKKGNKKEKVNEITKFDQRLKIYLSTQKKQKGTKLFKIFQKKDNNQSPNKNKNKKSRKIKAKHTHTQNNKRKEKEKEKEKDSFIDGLVIIQTTSDKQDLFPEMTKNKIETQTIDFNKLDKKENKENKIKENGIDTKKIEDENDDEDDEIIDVVTKIITKPSNRRWSMRYLNTVGDENETLNREKTRSNLINAINNMDKNQNKNENKSWFENLSKNEYEKNQSNKNEKNNSNNNNINIIINNNNNNLNKNNKKTQNNKTQKRRGHQRKFSIVDFENEIKNLTGIEINLEKNKKKSIKRFIFPSKLQKSNQIKNNKSNKNNNLNGSDNNMKKAINNKTNNNNKNGNNSNSNSNNNNNSNNTINSSPFKPLTNNDLSKKRANIHIYQKPNGPQTQSFSYQGYKKHVAKKTKIIKKTKKKKKKNSFSLFKKK